MTVWKFWSNNLGGKGAWEGGVVTLRSLWSLKKDTRTFKFHLSAPSPNFLGPLFWYDHPWKKQQQRNKHPSVIFFLTKNSKIPHFCKQELETSTLGFSDALSLRVWFSLIFLDLKGVFPPFPKSGQFAQDRNFWWTTLNLMNYIYLESSQ